MRNRKEGFTLIELLIVIAIIGILAAVLIPNLLDARRRAQDTGGQACLKELATAAETFYIDNATYDGAFAASVDGIGACNRNGANLDTLAADNEDADTYAYSVDMSANGGTNRTFDVTPDGGVQGTDN